MWRSGNGFLSSRRPTEVPGRSPQLSEANGDSGAEPPVAAAILQPFYKKILIFRHILA